jgi:transcriptional regulator with XRE-family HTH domain
MKRKREQTAKTKAKRPDYKIGAKVRKARLTARLKLEELAKRSGLSKALLSRIENDKITPSIGSLHDLAVALGINLSGFFNNEENREPQVVLRKGERHVIQMKDGSTIENCIPLDGTHLLQCFLMIQEPGGQAQGIVTHYGEEVGYVIEGEFELTLNGSVYCLKAGDSFNFRSEGPHTHRNPGKTRVVVLWVNTPPTW